MTLKRVIVLPNFPVNFVGNLFPVGVGYNPNSRDGRGGRAGSWRSPRAGGAAGAGAGSGCRGAGGWAVGRNYIRTHAMVVPEDLQRSQTHAVLP